MMFLDELDRAERDLRKHERETGRHDGVTLEDILYSETDQSVANLDAIAIDNIYSSIGKGLLDLSAGAK